MSVFLAPPPGAQITAQTRQFRAYILLVGVRKLSLILALLGAFGSLLHFVILGIFRHVFLSGVLITRLGGLFRPEFLPVWIACSLLGLATAIGSSIFSGRLAAYGGGALLDAMRDDPSQRSLMQLLGQMRDAHVLLHPVFRLGHDVYDLDLAIVSAHGLTFVSSTSRATVSDVAPLKAVCKRLSEQYSLPLLARVRFILLTAGTIAEIKPVVDWQPCNTREISRLFQRMEGGPGVQEMARSLRALYNLSLSAQWAPIPVQGSLPAAIQVQTTQSREDRHRQGRHAETSAKVFLFGLLGIFLCVIAVYLLRMYDYEMTEKLLFPVRAMLRTVLPQPWQDQLALGREILYSEEHVFARTGGQPVRLSRIVGQPGDGPLLSPGIEVQIVQEKADKTGVWYLVRSAVEAGWLPHDALIARHLVRSGTPLYERPAGYASAQEIAGRDSPVALLSVWHRTTPEGQVVWSKIAFLDKRVRYIKGES